MYHFTCSEVYILCSHPPPPSPRPSLAAILLSVASLKQQVCASPALRGSTALSQVICWWMYVPPPPQEPINSPASCQRALNLWSSCNITQEGRGKGWNASASQFHANLCQLHVWETVFSLVATFWGGKKVEWNVLGTGLDFNVDKDVWILRSHYGNASIGTESRIQYSKNLSKFDS